MKKALVALSLIMVFSFLVISCNPGGSPDNSQNSPAPPLGVTGTISTGQITQASPVPVTTAGGRFTLNKPGEVLDGMELAIPPGSYPEDRQFEISYAPVEKHTFGEAFNPLTPLISVDNGGGYSASLMTIKVPVKVPAGSFAMGFLYDENTKKLEGMPLISRDADSITVGTLHFSKFLISMVDESVLKKDIDTGFKPGVDDWQFTNRGSYIASGGHCAGQSVAALWYYVTQPNGKDSPLWGRYDNNGNKPGTPNFDQDDSLAYRFVSMVHSDIKWDSLGNEFWTYLAGVNDELTWKLFAYSMRLTGEPQEVGIYSKAGGGHDMICYRIYQGNLYIADPNYPGDTERRIEYADGKFKPYNSGANADEIQKGNGKAYETIQYCAKTTTVDWSQISQRWTELKNKTVGYDKFPNYDIVWVDDKDQSHVLNDGEVFRKDLANISVEADQAGVYFDVFRDEKKLSPDSKGNFQLNPGKNLLGILVSGEVNGKTKYIDFKYVNVVYDPGLSIDPPALNGVATTHEYIFTAKTDPQLGGSRFDWYIDGKLMQSKPDDYYTVTFNSEGKYTVSVKMFDKNGKELATAQSVATITEAASTPAVKPTSASSGSKLSKYQAMKEVTVKVGGKQTYEYISPGKPPLPETSTSVETTDRIVRSIEIFYKTKITWSGTSFSGKGSPNDNPALGTWEVSGTLSPDGNTLVSFSYSINTTAAATMTSGISHEIRKIGLKNVPLDEPAAYSSRTLITGSQVKDYVAVLEYVLNTTLNGTDIPIGNRYISTDWSATGDDAPFIMVVFQAGQ